MFGTGEPKILEWKLLKDALSGIGLLKYYAGDFGDGEGLEYVAIIDTRANKVVVTALDLSGKKIKLEGTGLLARAFQHEIDHLNGILFIDYLT